jgi:hypothetical protein
MRRRSEKIIGIVVEPAATEKLWKLHRLLRRLAADRGAWTSARAGAQAMSVQRPSSTGVPRLTEL